LSTSEAVDLGIADAFRLVLLHSEVGYSGTGHSYLLGLNGTEIGTDDQLGKGCALDAAGLASLTCLTASGGLANGLTTGAAEVLGVKTALGLNPVAAFSTAASSGAGSTPLILPAGSAPLLTADTARAVTPAGTATAEAALPRTGVGAASLAASGLAALLSGAALRLFGRRRRTA
jgi:LPXTG-motif cell wall-anchored protein